MLFENFTQDLAIRTPSPKERNGSSSQRQQLFPFWRFDIKRADWSCQMSYDNLTTQCFSRTATSMTTWRLNMFSIPSWPVIWFFACKWTGSQWQWGGLLALCVCSYVCVCTGGDTLFWLCTASAEYRAQQQNAYHPFTQSIFTGAHVYTMDHFSSR